MFARPEPRPRPTNVPFAATAPITPLAARRPADGTQRFTLFIRKPGDTAQAPLGTMNDVTYRVDTLTRALVAGDIQQLPHGARFRLVAVSD